MLFSNYKDYLRSIKYLFNAHLLRPSFRINSLYELPELLQKLNIESIIFDIDQTLIPFGEDEVDDSVKEVLSKLTKMYNICLLSNFYKSQHNLNRVKSISRQIAVKTVDSNFKKPAIEAFMDAVTYLKSDTSRIAMVGDRLLTDILGANNMGIKSILIKPINPKTDQIPIKVARSIETAILFFIDFFCSRKIEQDQMV